MAGRATVVASSSPPPATAPGAEIATSLEVLDIQPMSGGTFLQTP